VIKTATVVIGQAAARRAHVLSRFCSRCAVCCLGIVATCEAIQYFTEGIKASTTSDRHAAAAAASCSCPPPILAHLYSNRSGVYAEMRKWPAAMKDAKKCVELAPDWRMGYSRQCDVHEGMKEQEQAASADFKASDVGAAVTASQKAVSSSAPLPRPTKKEKEKVRTHGSRQSTYGVCITMLIIILAQKCRGVFFFCSGGQPPWRLAPSRPLPLIRARIPTPSTTGTAPPMPFCCREFAKPCAACLREKRAGSGTHTPSSTAAAARPDSSQMMRIGICTRCASPRSDP